MKRAGLYLLIGFALNFIGNILWFLVIIFNDPIFGSGILEELMLFLIFTLYGIFGLLGSYLFYKKASSI